MSQDDDSEIDRAEKILSSMSISDANMRLMLNMTRLTDTVSTLSSTVTSLTVSVRDLTQDVNGVQGVRSELKDIRRDVRDNDRKTDSLADKMDKAQVVLWRVVWFLTIVGLITLVSDIRYFAPHLLTEGLK